MNQDKTAVRFDRCAHFLANHVVRRDGRTDRDASVLGDLGRYKPNTPDVDIAMLAGKAQL